VQKVSAISAMAATPVLLEPNVDTSSRLPSSSDISKIRSVCTLPPPRHASDEAQKKSIQDRLTSRI
ncbi:MAG: hypothetical protein K7J15_02980, partial [Candidatus Regiella insecticola]|nr:hypothetical protein [Candidatus Regiella insecticola]